MAEKEKNPHAGHRQRVRAKFLNDGNLDSFAEHNILELLLFYSVPRADTNELAHKLTETFGSLKGVFDAPYELLTQIDGIGENSAVLIKLIPALVRVYSRMQTSDINIIKSTQNAVDFLRPKFTTLKNESLVLLCMNHAGKILKCSVISNGGIDYTQVDIRKILFEVLGCHATDIIIAHNHPSGLSVPSKSDMKTTQVIANALTGTGTTLKNHLIITDDEHFSFADNVITKKYLRSDLNNPFIANEEEEEDS